MNIITETEITKNEMRENLDTLIKVSSVVIIEHQVNIKFYDEIKESIRNDRTINMEKSITVVLISIVMTIITSQKIVIAVIDQNSITALIVLFVQLISAISVYTIMQHIIVLDVLEVSDECTPGLNSSIDKVKIVLKTLLKNCLKMQLTRKQEFVEKFLINAINVNKKWKDLEKDNYLNEGNDIPKEWQDEGFTNDGLTCGIVKIVVPLEEAKQNEKTKTVDYESKIEDIIKIEGYKKQREQWKSSDLSINMNILSIKKVYLRPKLEVDIKAINNMGNKMMKYFSKLPFEKITYYQAAKKALSTKGTAGEYGKQMIIESVIKDKTKEEIVMSWAAAIPLIQYFVTNCNDRLKEYFDYKSYKKVEIVGMEDGTSPPKQVKTRILSAPNLLLRVPDVKAFFPLNEAMARYRLQLISQVGINIMVELKWIMRPWDKRVELYSLDVSNFDASQHPQLQVYNLLTRLRHMDNNLVHDILSRNYLVKRYCLHIRKKITSDIMEIKTIGQQATGDITTSDDNTMRASALMMQIMQQLETKKVKFRQNRLREIDSFAQGDDCILRHIISEYQTQKRRKQIYETIENEARKIGWPLKYIKHTNDQDNKELKIKGVYLGYTVRMFKVQITVEQSETQNQVKQTLQFKVPLIDRVEDRFIGKLMRTIKAEKLDVEVTRNKDINSINKDAVRVWNGKMLTAIYTFFHRPVIVIYAVATLLKLRSKMEYFQDVPYNLKPAFENIQNTISITDSFATQTGIAGAIKKIKYKNDYNEDEEVDNACKTLTEVLTELLQITEKRQLKLLETQVRSKERLNRQEQRIKQFIKEIQVENRIINKTTKWFYVGRTIKRLQQLMELLNINEMLRYEENKPYAAWWTSLFDETIISENNDDNRKNETFQESTWSSCTHAILPVTVKSIKEHPGKILVVCEKCYKEGTMLSTSLTHQEFVIKIYNNLE